MRPNVDFRAMDEEQRKALDTKIVAKAVVLQELSKHLDKYFARIGIAGIVMVLLFLTTGQVFIALFVFAITGAFFCVGFVENYVQDLSFKYWHIHDDIYDFSTKLNNEHESTQTDD